MVDCGGSVAMPPLARCGPGPPCAVAGPFFYSCGVPPPWPPPMVAAPAMFISSPSMRYASVVEVWSLVVTSFLQVVMKSLCFVP
jgi:hypothetical protein